MIFTAVPARAVDLFAGIGAEANMYSRSGIAAGGSLSLGLEPNRHIAAGLRFTYCRSTDQMDVLEPAAFFRFCLPLHRSAPFAEASAGAAVLFDKGIAYPVFAGGLGLGWRFPLGRAVYIEPAVRTGYPFVWAAGLSTGFRFTLNPAGNEPAALSDNVLRR